MKPMCETNCGRRTHVYGSMYCPECHRQYSGVTASLVFRPASQKPHYTSEPDKEFLLLNPCDGWHIAFAEFDDDGMEFVRFTDFMGAEEFEEDSFVAWAELPDLLKDTFDAFRNQKTPQ